MTQIEDLLAKIHRAGFRLRVVEDDLQLDPLPSVPDPFLPPDLYREMMRQQSELYELLQPTKAKVLPFRQRKAS